MFHFLIKRTQQDNTARTQRDTTHAKPNMSTARLSLFLLFALAFSCVPIEEVSELELVGVPAGTVSIGRSDVLELYLPDGSLAEGVRWSSNYPEIVEIHPITGRYIPQSDGTARIFYMYGTITGSTTIDVTGIADPAMEITIDPASIPSGGVNIEDTGTLTATIDPLTHTDGNIRWSSSDEGFVDINMRTGEYTAVGIGTAIITAQIGSVSDTTPIQVLGGTGSNSATGIVFNPQPPSSLERGSNGVLNVDVTPSDHIDGDVVWVTNPPGVLTITVSSTDSTTASYEAIAINTVTITATVGTSLVTITSGLINVVAAGSGTKPAQSIEFLSPPASLTESDSDILSVAVTPADHTDGDVMWQSSPPGLLMITPIDGTDTASYQAIGSGEVTITVSVGSAIPALHTVTITSSGGGGGSVTLVFSPIPSNSIEMGSVIGTATVVATPISHGLGAVQWMSDDVNIISIVGNDLTAQYFGIGLGTATITATLDTASVSRTITVTPP